jgi:hypothetical protein
MITLGTMRYCPMKLNDLDNLKDGPDLSDEERVREAQDFLDEVEALMVQEHVQYARDTLDGIFETVSEKMRVTEAQREAIRNIDEGGQRGGRREDRW